jgi:hypothetical protein
MSITNKLVVDIAVSLTDAIERLCPAVLDRMTAGLGNIRGKHFRIHAVEVDEDTTVLKVTGLEDRKPGELTLLQSMVLMDIPERARLLADLYEIAR